MCHYTATARLVVEPRPESVATARQFVRDRACRYHATNLLDVAILLVSELVTNTVHYGAPPVAVQIDCHTSHGLQVRVSDSGRDLPTLTSAEPEDDGGRGLTIVDLLSDAWGIVPQAGGGKIVWFCLAPAGTPSPGRSSAAGHERHPGSWLGTAS